MTELYFSVVDIKHLFSFIKKNIGFAQPVMLQVVTDAEVTYLTVEHESAPKCTVVSQSGSGNELENEWDEEFPVDERFLNLLEGTDNWGHLVLAFTDDEMNVFLEDNGMRGCLN